VTGGDGAPTAELVVVFEELRRRFRGFPVPADDKRFDPSHASQEELLYYGLPPRPDPRSQPRVYEAWQRGFGQPLTLNSFAFTIAQLSELGYRPYFREEALVQRPSRYVASLNWSGAYLAANRFKKFMQIWGIWTVPNNLQQAPVPPAVKLRPFNCSVWIGLDGQRRYLNSSLPQIGTTSTYDATAPGNTVAQAWTQWWDRENPQETLPVPMSLAVDPGNEVLSVLTAVSPRHVHLVMVNLSQGKAIAVWASSPSVTLDNGRVVPLEISGATAEWIVERPMIPGGNDLSNLPDYPPTEFDACLALEADDVNIFFLPTARTQVLQSERLIRMYEVEETAQRISFISMPHRKSETSVRMTHGDF